MERHKVKKIDRCFAFSRSSYWMAVRRHKHHETGQCKWPHHRFQNRCFKQVSFGTIFPNGAISLLSITFELPSFHLRVKDSPSTRIPLFLTMSTTLMWMATTLPSEECSWLPCLLFIHTKKRWRKSINYIFETSTVCSCSANACDKSLAKMEIKWKG